MKKTNKKGQIFDQLSGLAIAIATVAMIIVIGALVGSKVFNNLISDSSNVCEAGYTYNSSADNCCTGLNCAGANITAPNAAYNATREVRTQQTAMVGWVGLIIIIFIGIIILGLVKKIRG